MAIHKHEEREQAFALNELANRWVFETNGAETVVLAAQPHSTWTTAVITWYPSQDGVTREAFDTPVVFNAPTPAYAVQRSETIDCSTFRYLIGVVTTPEGADRHVVLSALLSKSTL